MKTLMLILLVMPSLAYAEDANKAARIGGGGWWWSASCLERIAQDYVKQHDIEFAFDNTKRVVEYDITGTNSVAKIWFSSGGDKPTLYVEIAYSGEVITTQLISGVIHFVNPRSMGDWILRHDHDA